ncbi:MAG: UDP-N-acetylmuramate dehydrogenase [Thalassotalea sp.]
MNNQNISLQPLNTFSAKASAERFITINTEQDLGLLTGDIAIAISLQHFYLLGEGSNTLFVEPCVQCIIKSAIKGISFQETEQDYIVEAGAGENWHQLVETCLARGIYGFENLALIPGSVGAAPVQNIGAYGVELAKFCHQVYWYDFDSQVIEVLSNQQCQFSYRESIFKKKLKNKGMITKVSFKLPKTWQPELSYQGLADLPLPVTAQAIFEQVIAIRTSKLPDPKQLPNAGSFFKNPIVAENKFQTLLKQYQKIPAYRQADNQFKLAAGWLIEQAGLKGHTLGKVSVHQHQALVIVNHDGGNGQDIVALAKLIQNKVMETFEIMLEPEVRFVNALGECNAVEVLNNVE